MAIRDALLPELDQEMATTRSLLERVPEEHGAWKPHPKSFSLGDLALHISQLPFWGITTIRDTEWNAQAPGNAATPAFESTAQVLERFDKNVAAMRAALAEASDEDLMVPWSLKNGDVTVFTLPRVVTLRGFVFSHLIHHRGQLSVYLRLKDVPLPSIYGPTADTPM
jgi:uncharacterized damage-inducible protein DinB